MLKRLRFTWTPTKIENIVLKSGTVYMGVGLVYTLLCITVSASTEKLQLKNDGEGV